MPLIFVLIFIMQTIEEQKKKKAEYDKIYREKNKERIRKNKSKWYCENKERKKEYDEKYRNEHIEERKKVKEKWDKRNKKNVSEYNKIYYSTILGLAKRRKNHYLADDKNKGFDTANTIDENWIVENILTNNKCIYCGDNEPSHLGCDRIDNDKGHTPDNVVCSCPICNWERYLENLSVEEFIEYRKTHPRFKEKISDNIDRKTGEKKPLKKKII